MAVVKEEGRRVVKEEGFPLLGTLEGLTACWAGSVQHGPPEHEQAANQGPFFLGGRKQRKKRRYRQESGNTGALNAHLSPQHPLMTPLGD